VVVEVEVQLVELGGVLSEEKQVLWKCQNNEWDRKRSHY
jgi:hypothetical protein